MASLWVKDTVVGEGDGYVEVLVWLDGPAASPVTVGYTTSSASAGGNDVRGGSGTLTFAPGETTKTVRFELVNDTAAEGPQYFVFGLRNATNATIARAEAMVRIVDNDTVVDQPEFYVGDLVVDEKAGTASFEVRLGAYWGQSAGAPISVDFATADGTALAGQDFVARSGRLSFAPGESVKTVVVDLIDDALAEPLERFSLVLGNPQGARLGDGVAVAEIGASDAAPVVTPRISVADRVVGEADRYAEMVVNLHAPSGNTVTVGYTTSSASAGGNDVRGDSGTLTFAPGETTKTVRFELVNDTAAEGPEHFNFGLRNPTNATIARAEAMVQIVDDDGSARLLLSHGRSDDFYTIASGAVDFIEAADGGRDIVRSAASYTLPANIEGLFLTGSAVVATGNALPNIFRGNAANNLIDGLGGVDTVVFDGPASAYAVTGTVAEWVVSGGGQGTDTLRSIERLVFADTVRAYDTSPGGNTFAAHAMLFAAFNSAPSPTMLGQWTSQLDQLGSTRELAQQMINFYAPGVGNDTLVAHLWSTIVGTPLAPGDQAYFVGLIDDGSFTQASLLEMVSTLDLNTADFAALIGQPMAMDPAFFQVPA